MQRVGVADAVALGLLVVGVDVGLLVLGAAVGGAVGGVLVGGAWLGAGLLVGGAVTLGGALLGGAGVVVGMDGAGLVVGACDGSGLVESVGTGATVIAGSGEELGWVALGLASGWLALGLLAGCEADGLPEAVGKEPVALPEGAWPAGETPVEEAWLPELPELPTPVCDEPAPGAPAALTVALAEGIVGRFSESTGATALTTADAATAVTNRMEPLRAMLIFHLSRGSDVGPRLQPTRT